MWNDYARKQGVAICTTVRKLRTGLSFPSCIRSVFDCSVDYEDLASISFHHIQGELEPYGMAAKFFRKQRNYESEREFRMIEIVNTEKDMEDHKGIIVPILNPNQLIDQIFIAPNADNSIVDEIKSLAKRLGLERKVQKSIIK